jgi:muramoyltetrapeptide carboxypeptidase
MTIHQKLAPSLQPGDTIALIAPASAFEPKRFRLAVQWLLRRGYRVKYSRGIFSKDGYLAGSDARRTRELRAALHDPSVKAVFAARGGYGSMRLLWMPRIKTRKLESLSTKEKENIFSQLESPASRILRAPKDFVVFRTGQAKGKLFGGNLSMVQSTLSTPYVIPFRSSLLFLEEVNEPAYRIDRMFAQLALSGVFSKVRALILGELTDEKGKPHSMLWIKQILGRYVTKQIPILVGLRFGHTQADILLPIGGHAHILEKGRRLLISSLAASRRISK